MNHNCLSSSATNEYLAVSWEHSQTPEMLLVCISLWEGTLGRALGQIGAEYPGWVSCLQGMRLVF